VDGVWDELQAISNGLQAIGLGFGEMKAGAHSAAPSAGRTGDLLGSKMIQPGLASKTFSVASTAFRFAISRLRMVRTADVRSPLRCGVMTAISASPALNPGFRHFKPLLAEQISVDYIGAVPTINLTNDEFAAVTAAIRRAIEDDRFPHAPRLDPLRAALGKFEAASEPTPLPKAPTAADKRARR
jgi:hypothetical protein